MKCSNSFVFTIVALLIGAGLLWHHWNEMANAPVMAVSQSQGGGALYVSRHSRINSPAPQQSSNQAPHADELQADQPIPLRVNCANNLKQIALCLNEWELNHYDQYPWDVSTNMGGSKEFCDLDKDGFDRNAWRHFQVMSNELGSTKLLICPDDRTKTPAANFAHLGPSNVSFRLCYMPGTNYPSNPGKTPLIVCPVDGNTVFYDSTVEAGKP